MVGLKSNKISDVYQWFNSIFITSLNESEKRAIANEVFLRFFKLRPEVRIAYPKKRISESDIIRLKGAANRLNRGEPVQYITGETEFMDYTIRVKPGVLIPRQETEQLILWMLSSLKEAGKHGDQKLRILDIGTGSGCIAISLARLFPESEVHASDISEKALEVAEHNLLINNVSVSLFQDDIISGKPEIFNDAFFDCIVSNPPYVLDSERQYMAVHVLEHEPATALFVPDDDPLLFYRHIARKAHRWLKPGGLLYFEINEKMGKACSEEIVKAGFSNVVIYLDIHGKERFLRAER